MTKLFRLLATFAAQASALAVPVAIENAHFRYTISPEGRNLAFVDRATGVDYLKGGAISPCAFVRRDAQDFPVTAVTITNRHLTLDFGGAEVTALLRVETRSSYIQLTVETIRGPEIDSLVFLNVPLTLQGRPDDPFGACTLSLNLQTRVDQLPALQTEFRAACYRKFGFEGAKVALVGMPVNRMLPALKEVLSETDEMPLCKVAGPWAREIPFNHGSYLFNFGALTETNLADWIAMTKSLGFTQIDNHGGSAAFFRFGDFELNREKWPEGWDTYGRIVARLHTNGIDSIFHTYAFFIDKQSKYVTPVPDRRLDAFRTFTLATEITADADEIPVRESTSGMSTVTGFFEHNSVVLHLDDELVTFGGVSQQSPWHFTQVKRGAFGTRPAAHPPGTTARHLTECFGLFVPNPETSLFEEIAANHAEVVNRCDFDGIYLDAIDGSSILRGADECWYWADKFVMEIQRRLRKPVGMEMSAMWHHFWQYRTRWQAWDYPQRGHRRFIDLHADAVHGGLLLPLHLGWWNFQSFNPPQVEPTYPEVIEYLGAKLIGWDAGISLTGGVDRQRLQSIPLFRRAVDTLRTCEELRHAGVIDEKVKAELRQPGKEFALGLDAAGRHRFQRAHSESHTVSLAEPWTLAWIVTNPFPQQPVRLRLEALMSAAPPDDPRAQVIAEFSDATTAEWKASAAAGVRLSHQPAGQADEAGAALLLATNAGSVHRTAAWARLTRRFEPPRNLKEQQALGVWIEGDGLGELLAFRLESPRHIAFGAVADRYVNVDFTGRRFCTLVETESTRWNDFVWGDGKALYNVYRETIDFSAVDSISVGYQNLAPGTETRCRVGPLKALPMVEGTLRDPTLLVNGEPVAFPGELRSGSWIEFRGPDRCVLYDRNGAELRRLTPRGAGTLLPGGGTRIEFTCAPGSGPPPRARITLFVHGEML